MKCLSHVIRASLSVAVGLLMLGTVASAQEKAAAPRLIVRGDDMGYSHAGNEAIQMCYKEGITTSVEVIAPSPWFPEAVKMLAENPTVDVGVHLCLTSEWDNVKWRPLTEAKSLRDADGYFYPMVRPNKNYPGRSLAEHDWKIEDVEREFRAQIELVKQKLPHVSHISGHMGCDSLSEDVKAMVKKLTIEYGVDVNLTELGVKGIGYTGPKKTFEEKLTSFMKTLDRLEAGHTYLFVDHPGLDTLELRAIHHIGYEDVAEDRQGVTSLWTDPRVKKHIEARGIELIGYDDLKKK